MHHQQNSWSDQTQRDFRSVIVEKVEFGEIDVEPSAENLDLLLGEVVSLLIRLSRNAFLSTKSRLVRNDAIDH